jgi:hypothetical protein
VEETPARLPLPTQPNRLPRAGHPPRRRQGLGTPGRHEPPAEGPYPLSTGRACTPRPVEPPVASQVPLGPRLRYKAFDPPHNVGDTLRVGGLTQQQAPRSFQEALRELSISTPGTLLRRRTHPGAGVAPRNSNPSTPSVGCQNRCALTADRRQNAKNYTPGTPGPLHAAHPPQAGREFQPKDHTALSTPPTPGMTGEYAFRTNLPYEQLSTVVIRDQCEHAGQNCTPSTLCSAPLRSSPLRSLRSRDGKCRSIFPTSSSQPVETASFIPGPPPFHSASYAPPSLQRAPQTTGGGGLRAGVRLRSAALRYTTLRSTPPCRTRRPPKTKCRGELGGGGALPHPPPNPQPPCLSAAHLAPRHHHALAGRLPVALFATGNLRQKAHKPSWDAP